MVIEIAMSFADADITRANGFVKLLTPRLENKGTAYEFTIWRWDHDAVIGLNNDSQIERAFASSPYVIQLISPAFQASPYIQQKELALAATKARLPIGLVRVDLAEGVDTTVTLLVGQRRRFFSECGTAEMRERFADHAADKIVRRIQHDEQY